MSKKIIALVLCLAALSAAPVQAFATEANSTQETMAEPRYAVFNTVSCNISRSGSTLKILPRATTPGSSISQQTTLQCRSTLGTWFNVKTWSGSAGSYASFSYTYTIGKGTYRAISRFTAGGETVSVTSQTITY